MKKQEYPFVKCLNPKSIVNPYTNEPLLVECGKCKACRCRKGSIASLKCKLESLSHKYCMFVTLTYNRYALPLMNDRVTTIDSFCDKPYIDKSRFDELIELTPRLGVGTVLGISDSSPKFIKELKAKVNTSNLLPHLSKRDIQLFMKRLRKYISKYETEKIRYYAVGEYGPVHFRPHYHLLLWFSSEQTYKIIRQAIHSCWSYGRVDVETSLGKSADYVAKYVNGSCSLPRIYQQKETKPFALHSNHLGEMVLKKSKDEIYRMPVREFVTRRIPITSVTTDVNLWRSLKTFYFPRCKNYALRNESERLYAYRTYDEARRIYNEGSLVTLADSILSDICQFNEDFELLDVNSFTDIDKSKENLVRYFMSSAKVNPNDLYLRESYERYFRAIYMELRLSRHFIDFVCDSRMSCLYKMYKKVESFWLEVDYINLVHQYESMEEWCEQHFSDETDLQMFYSNISHDMEEYKTKQYYKDFHCETEQQYESSVKHKKLNDMNNIFADK